MTGSPAYDIGYVIGALLPIVVVVGIIVVVVGLVMRSRRSPHTSVAGQAIQMSDDGRYWWDGSSWQDATTTVPPHAQRSPDGAYWWDGKSWRPVRR